MKTLYKLRDCKTIQKDFFVFDVETNGLRAKPDAFIFGVVYGWNFYKVIYSVSDFIAEFQSEKYKGKKVFAHNASYDLDTIYGNIYELDPTAIFNGKFICASNGNCSFADSMNIYPTSVKNLGSMLGIEKMELSESFLTGNNEQHNVSKKDIEYCIQDCKIVYEALFQAFEFAGQICITQASLSMAYFRRYHLPYNISFNDNSNVFFNSYYGGRTEAFKLGNTHAHCYDANSMYPFAMRYSDFPNPRSLKRLRKISKKHFLEKYLFQYEGCAHVEVEHKNYWLGYLPLKHNNKLIFPVGKFSSWWNFNELRFAVESGKVTIKRVFDMVYGEKMETIFSSFVDTLYTKRFQTDDPFEIYRVKVYMNSLYGKFAQRITEETTYIEDVTSLDAIEMIDQAKASRRFIKLQMFNMERLDGYLITSKEQFKQPSYSIPSFASYITSFSRITLLKKLLDSEKYKPVYCDTDSVFCEFELPEEHNIIDNNIPRLGAWKKEDKIVTKIRGLKNYDCISKGKFERHIKGIPNKFTKVNNLQCYDEYNYSYRTLVKTKEAIKRNIESGVLVTRTKHLKKNYDKRKIDHEKGEGWTIPLVLDE